MEAMDYNIIKDGAHALGACALINEAKSLPNLLHLLFTPQGVEFASVKRFPTAQIWREIKPHMPDKVIKVDAGDITLENPAQVVLAGNTHARIKYTIADYRCELLVFEGATAQVEISGYGLVFWADCGAKEIKITTKEHGKAYEL